MAQSIIRRAKRLAKKKAHLSFSERVTESIRTGTPIKRVEYELVDDIKNRHLVAKEVV